MYYDLYQKKNIDSKLAVKYDSCCYSLGVQAERYNKPNNYTMTSRNETKFGVFFELKGLANVGADTSFTAETKLLPYNDTVNLSK
jgi:LPS-assembly protein